MSLPIVTTYSSPNHEPRQGTPVSLLVLHATAGGLDGSLAWLCNPESRVSTHYLIDRDGTTYQLVDESLAAWHAGVSLWKGLGSNAIKLGSISVELVNRNDGRDPYPLSQMMALHTLTRDILNRYPCDIVTHAQIARPAGRKSDPAGFPLSAFLASLNRPPSYSEDSPIMGATILAPAPAAERIATKPGQHYTDTEIRTFVKQYYALCRSVGVDPVIALAQMCHETGWLTSAWSARPYRNPAGLGVTGEVSAARPAPAVGWQHFPADGLWRKGLAFETWIEAIPVHVGRLVAYAVAPDTRTPEQAQLVTVALARRPLPAKLHGSAPTIKLLGAHYNPTGDGWADPGLGYGAAIARVATQIGGL